MSVANVKVLKTHERVGTDKKDVLAGGAWLGSLWRKKRESYIKTWVATFPCSYYTQKIPTLSPSSRIKQSFVVIIIWRIMKIKIQKSLIISRSFSHHVPTWKMRFLTKIYRIKNGIQNTVLKVREGKSHAENYLNFSFFQVVCVWKCLEMANKRKKLPKEEAFHCLKAHTMLYKLDSLRDEVFTFIDAINNCGCFLYFLVRNNNENWVARIVGRKKNVSIIFLLIYRFFYCYRWVVVVIWPKRLPNW